MHQLESASLISRIRNVPKPVGLTLLALPVAATVGVVCLPSVASASMTGAPSGTTTATGTTAARSITTTAHVAKPGAARAGSAFTRPSNSPNDAALAAFFRAGYTYPDAVLLARYWGSTMSTDEAKVSAGTKLLHGLRLPIRHGQTAWTVSRTVAVEAFANNGYSYDDAQKLAALWKVDVAKAKATGGHKVLAGLTLPVGHGTGPATEAKDVAAFFKAGYDYNDAVLLSRFWANGETPYDAKVRAGAKLLQHVTLPITHGQTAQTVSTDVAAAAFFNNGYDTADAQKLAKLWKISTPGGDLTTVKVKAGRLLLAGNPLPITR